MADYPAKVVYIETQYVETDALSFKSVVQNLTGKDSVIPGSPPAATEGGRRRRQSPAAAGAISRRLPKAKTERADEYYRPKAAEALKPEIKSNKLMGGLRNSFLMRDLSFKEFDKLLKELPPLDDFHSLFCE